MFMESTAITLQWNQIITIFLSSAVISGSLSAFINYLFNQRKSQKEREAIIIQDKLSLYSILIIAINRLLDIGSNAFPPTTEYIKKECVEIFSTLDTVLLNKSYLLEKNAFSEYSLIKMVYLQQTHRTKWDLSISKNDEGTVKSQLEKLKEMLVATYNNNIMPEYKKIVGKGTVEKQIQKI